MNSKDYFTYYCGKHGVPFYLSGVIYGQAKDNDTAALDSFFPKGKTVALDLKIRLAAESDAVCARILNDSRKWVESVGQEMKALDALFREAPETHLGL